MTPPDRLITACPIGCGGRFVVSSIELPEGGLLCCEHCGQLVSQISESAYRASMLAFDSPQFNLPGARETERRMGVATRRLTRLCSLLNKQAGQIRVLDVGCSRVDFVAAATMLGFDAEGVEPAPHIAEAAREAGRRVHTGRLEDQHFADGSFDAVTLFEVIEHLTEPIPLLLEIRRILSPDGMLLLSTGNGASWTAELMQERWDYFQIRVDAGHVSFFNPYSIALLAQRTGFSVADLRTSRVRLLDKGQAPAPVYLLAKVAAELLNVPARLMDKGHDMLVYLRRQEA